MNIELKKIISESKYILGIFGNYKKNVTSLKIYMSLASQNWVITKETDAIAEINFKNIVKLKNIT